MHRLRILPAVAILLAAWALLTVRIGAPWLGHQDMNGVWVSSAIRNYEHYGFFQLGGIAVFNNAPAPPDRLMYYTHRPAAPDSPNVNVNRPLSSLGVRVDRGGSMRLSPIISNRAASDG